VAGKNFKQNNLIKIKKVALKILPIALKSMEGEATAGLRIWKVEQRKWWLSIFISYRTEEELQIFTP